jgi:enoyl-coA hydratase/isomerase
MNFYNRQRTKEMFHMSLVLYEVNDSIAVITLNRAEKRNALNAEMIDLMSKYLHMANDDQSVRAIVIRGAGEKAFTAGFDLKESMENNITDIAERRQDTRTEIEFFKYLWYLPKPVICAVQGYCVGGGNMIALMSDLIVAADNATFGNPEMLLGYLPEIPIEVWKLPANKAMEWYLESKYYAAEEMREMGVVSEVVPFEQLMDRTMAIAKQAAKIPAESMKMLKEGVRHIYDIRGFSNSVDYFAEMFNLARTNMQQKDMGDFRNDISSGGLKSALNSRYQ